MNNSGDAAEQIVRMTLEGVEIAVRITGTAAKETALLILAALKSPEKDNADKLKLRGSERLNTMLKSGQPLEIFSVKESDLKKFTQGAKEYGIVYCALKNSKDSPDGLCDVMVKAADAPKINRLVERFKFAAVDKAGIEKKLTKEQAEKKSPPFLSEHTSDNKRKPESITSSKPSVKAELREIAAACKNNTPTPGTFRPPRVIKRFRDEAR